MKTKTRITRQLISILLCFVLLFNVLPIASLFVSAETSADYYNRIVDANTMDSWKDYFPLESANGQPLSTENAGGVWTDKSVFANTDAFPKSVTMIDDGKNFLTALSAIAANKEVVGYSTVPTDTILVLDVSGSMSSESVSQLVIAANNAIKSLQETNNNNRVGVVLYSGMSANSTGNQTRATTNSANQ